MSVELNQTPAQRLPLTMDVEFRRSYARQGESGVLRNISITGAFLETLEARHLNQDDKLLIRFVVSGRERKVTAQVVWHAENGCGLKFLPSNNRDVQIVDDLMYFVEGSRKSQRSILDNIFKKVS
ncbi:MAG: PilZ domain-containing protein [Pseudobdellovibrionaceae bacterium]|nr:PilZ domain-containing protein [Bdellovibrionales bacterium]USN46800.1 MAG: PilZ domain-containing protein [Pseudobdellovibrionaceae bacterium]